MPKGLQNPCRRTASTAFKSTQSSEKSWSTEHDYIILVEPTRLQNPNWFNNSTESWLTQHVYIILVNPTGLQNPGSPNTSTKSWSPQYVYSILIDATCLHNPGRSNTSSESWFIQRSLGAREGLFTLKCSKDVQCPKNICRIQNCESYKSRRFRFRVWSTFMTPPSQLILKSSRLSTHGELSMGWVPMIIRNWYYFVQGIHTTYNGHVIYNLLGLRSALWAILKMAVIKKWRIHETHHILLLW